MRHARKDDSVREKVMNLYRMALSSAQTTLGAPAGCRRRGCREEGCCLAYRRGQWCGEPAPKNITAVLDCLIAFPPFLDSHGWRLSARAPLKRRSEDGDNGEP